jgi:amino acid transporter
MHGQITFGQSVGAGVIICLYYAVIMAIFTYILYAFIDTGLTAKQMALAEEMLVKKGMPQATIDTAMAMQAKFMKPGIMALFVIFGSMIWGVILSLIISIFIKKEGNPLIDTPAN